MLIQKTNSVGVDAAIKLLQGSLYFKLLKAWGLELSPDSYMSYPRIYKNQRNDMFVPEWYEGAKEYKEIYFDDISAYSFFGVSDKTEFNGANHDTDVYLVFRVDLSKIKPGISHRADEEVHVDIQNIIKTGSYGFTYISMETGVKAAFREYSKWVEQTKYNDMHPWHVFRFNFKLNYNTNIC